MSGITPIGKGKQGRPDNTWRRTVDGDLNNINQASFMECKENGEERIGVRRIK